MYERKQQVIQNAHQLFIEKGYQATSIQDILGCSGISKGTFYNYFSSKSELLKAVFISVNKDFEKERNELLIGENLTDFETFINQIELRMHTYKKNKLFILIEEVFFSNDEELKHFIKQNKLYELRWMYDRFLDIFGKEKQPYLLDCAILFGGMLQHEFYFHVTYKIDFSESEVIRYCVERIKALVDDVSRTNVQLLAPEQLTNLLPDCLNTKQDSKNKLLQNISVIKKEVRKMQPDVERKKYGQILDFIHEELLLKDSPRYFLVESAILSLKMCPTLKEMKELGVLEEMANNHSY
jgi:AcrR family transcriptional regulator